MTLGQGPILFPHLPMQGHDLVMTFGQGPILLLHRRVQGHDFGMTLGQGPILFPHLPMQGHDLVMTFGQGPILLLHRRVQGHDFGMTLGQGPILLLHLPMQGHDLVMTFGQRTFERSYPIALLGQLRLSRAQSPRRLQSHRNGPVESRHRVVERGLDPIQPGGIRTSFFPVRPAGEDLEARPEPMGKPRILHHAGVVVRMVTQPGREKPVDLLVRIVHAPRPGDA